jgi:hypothetical protein
MTIIGALSSFREPREMSPHKRACHHLLSDGSAIRNNALGRIVGMSDTWIVRHSNLRVGCYTAR